LLWERSQVPFSREILGDYTGLADRKLNKHLTRLVDRGVLGVDADGGEIRWTVRGAAREPGGPETLDRFVRIQTLRAEARAKVARDAGNRRRRGAGKPELDAASPPPEPEPGASDDESGGRSMVRAGAGLAKGALGLVASAAAPLDGRKAKGRKSLALSAGLSLLGPLGWLYAGSFREAVPASLLYLGLAAIIPNALLWPILWFALPVSALAGLVYAWQHNSNGQRTPLFLGGGDKDD
jgi:hypothetical protein